jgi:hypothetical protein
MFCCANIVVIAVLVFKTAASVLVNTLSIHTMLYRARVRIETVHVFFAALPPYYLFMTALIANAQIKSALIVIVAVLIFVTASIEWSVYAHKGQAVILCAWVAIIAFFVLVAAPFPFLMHACALIAKISGAKVMVVAIKRCVFADSVFAKVLGAWVLVVAARMPNANSVACGAKCIILPCIHLRWIRRRT